MADAFLLSESDYRRIAAAVQWVERQLQTGGPTATPRTPTPLATLQRLGRTAADPDTSEYPAAEDLPNTYWVQWVATTFDNGNGPGQEERTDTILDDLPGGDGGQPGYALAQCISGEDETISPYVAEGTLVLCSWHNGRWWFAAPAGDLLGKLDNDLGPGATATVSIWAGTLGAEVDTGVNVTAADWLLKNTDADIAAGKKVILRWINGGWYVVEAECA